MNQNTPPTPYAPLSLQLKLCQQEMLYQVAESSFAPPHLISTKNKQTEPWLLKCRSIKYESHISIWPTAPLASVTYILFSPSNVLLRPSAPITTSNSKSETGWPEGRISARQPWPEEEHKKPYMTFKDSARKHKQDSRMARSRADFKEKKQNSQSRWGWISTTLSVSHSRVMFLGVLEWESFWTCCVGHAILRHLENPAQSSTKI